MSGLRTCPRHAKSGLRRALPTAAAALLLTALAPVALACSNEHRVVGLWSSDTLVTWLLPGMTLVNTDAAGCHSIYPFLVYHGASIVNQARLTNELGSIDGPNGRGGLMVGGLFDNQAGATVINDGEFFVGLPLDGRGELRNSGQFVNRRLLDLTGRLDNRGQFANEASLVNAGSLASSGMLYNTGTLTTLGTLANTGNLVNQGTLNFAQSTRPFAPQPRFSNAGGVLENRIGAVIDMGRAVPIDFNTGFWGNGVLRNSGTLRAVVLSTGAADGGTVELLASGTLENSRLTVAAGHTQTNDGRLLNTSVQVQSGGSLVHSGFSDGLADVEIGYGNTTLTNSGGIRVDRSTLRNFGTLSNTGNLEVRAQGRVENGFVFMDGSVGGQLDNHGVLQVLAGGRIDNLATLRSTVTLYNAGTIQSTGELDNSERFDNVGEFTSSGVLRSSGTAVNSGSFNVDGSFALDGWLFNSGTLVFGEGSVTTGRGRYQQTGGDTRVDGSVDIAAFNLTGGSLCGSGSIGGAVVVRNGRLCPGDSPGTLHIGGDLRLFDSVVEIEIAGTEAGSFDVLQVDGSISMSGGLLRLAFAPGYVPAPGTQWTFLAAAGQVTGLQTLSVDVVGLDAGSAVTVGADGRLSVVSAPVPVPEPGSLVLLVGGLFGLILRTRRGWAKMHRCCNNAPSARSPAPSAWACTVGRRSS